MLRQFIIFLFIFTHSLSLAEGLLSERCVQLTWEEILRNIPLERDTPQELTLVTSVNNLKEYNSIFGENNSLGEIMANLEHFFFQKFLWEHPQYGEIFKIIQGDSPYIKFTRLRIGIRNQDFAQMIEIINEIKQRAKNVMGELLTREDYVSTAAWTILQNEIKKTHNENSPPLYFTPSTWWPSTSPEIKRLEQQLPGIRKKLFQAFLTKEKIFEEMDKNYGIGIGNSSEDAHLNAKISSLSTNTDTSTYFFRRELMIKFLDDIKAKRKLLGIYFEQESIAQELFILMRMFFHEPLPKNWPPRLIEILNMGITSKNSTAALVGVFSSLRDYIRLLNIFDYLPTDKIVYNPNAQKDFENFLNPNHVLVFDIKQLGGRNIFLLHQLSMTLIEKMLHLEQKTQEWSLLEKNASSENRVLKKKEEVFRLYQEITEIRKNVFHPTAGFIDLVRDKIYQTVLTKVPSRDDIIMWASGDDMIVAYRGNIHPLEIFSSLESEIAQNLRFGFSQVQQKRFPLDKVRKESGSVSKISKWIEKKVLTSSRWIGLQFAIEYISSPKKGIKIFYRGSSEKPWIPLPKEYLDEIKLEFKDLVLY